MSTQMRDLSKQFEDKDFTKSYFFGVESGEDVTKKLVSDGATLNAPDLIARLVGWLEEAEPTEDVANKQAQTQQQLASLKLPSQETSSKDEESDEASSDGVITGDSPEAGGESSDGTTRTSSEVSKPKSFSLGGK